GSCLAITSAGGYKQREAVLTYRVLDDATSTTSTSNTSAPKLRWINPKFGDRAYHISIHESQKLLFAADPNRIKSFSWGKLNGENYQEALPVHTMNSKSFDGPISVLSNDRLIRAGKGSVAVWNLSSQPTHGTRGNKKIGKRYTCDAEDFFGDDIDLEPSSGSDPNSKIELTDVKLSPTIWEAHPSAPGSMICGFDSTRSQSFSCISMDLEHGGALTM
ncbi:hypothetical protein H0H93_016817, partial [Arthromyces matolae]